MNVAFVLYPRALVTGISLPVEMLTSAAVLRDRKLQKEDPLQIRLVAATHQSQPLTGGLTLQPDITFADDFNADIIVLPPMWGNPLSALKQTPGLTQWLVNNYQRSCQIIATGTGVVWPAQAGLLDNQVATTHWYYYEKFTARYPKVKLNRQASITAADGIYCTASINSQAEMLLYLITENFGQRIASIIETQYGHEVSRTSQQPFYQIGGQLQFDESIALAQDWMKRNLALSMTSQTIANQCGLPLRTFNRKFKEQVGQTPHQYLQQQRINTAQQLLRDFSMSIQDVAEQVGYKDSYQFSIRFKQICQITPSEYRHMVKAKIYNANA
ncbi:GlxA family transcriptional regulator [Celerinatantimonas sp. MCCC 1A17872]|uniref:GlxA family transcriptional regulator n=1 Tax=Celerinatantimonas sp. MCCC 1A17872 TaxID=3177514 RepID=UPI0038CA8635